MYKFDMLIPERIKEQCNSAIRTLKKDTEDIRKIQSSLQSFISDDELISTAYTALKMQLSDYLSVLSVMILANDMDIADFEQLKAAVGNEKLDGTAIKNNMSDAQRDRDYHNAASAEYRSMAYYSSWLVIGAMIDWYNDMANYHSACAGFASAKYNLWRAKEEKFDEINEITGKLFTSSSVIRDSARKGLESVRGAFQRGAYIIDMDAEWRNELSSAKNEIIKKVTEQFVTEKGKGQKEYNWEEIEELLGKKANEVSDLEYLALVNMVSNMTNEELMALFAKGQKNETNYFQQMFGGQSFYTCEVLQEMSDRYLAMATVLSEITIFNENSQYNYDEVQITNELSRATLIAQIMKSMYEGTGKKHNVEISSEESDGKVTYIAEVSVFADISANVGEPIVAEMQGKTIRVNPWGSTAVVEFDLEDAVIETLYSLNKSVTEDLAKTGGELILSYACEQLGKRTIDEAGKVLSYPVTAVQIAFDIKENYEHSVAINGAIDCIKTRRIIDAMGIHAGVVSVQGPSENSVQLICPKYDPEELLVRVAAYNNTNEQQITVEELKLAVENNGQILDKYLKWYSEGGDEDISEYWNELETIKTEYSVEKQSTDNVPTRELAVEQLQELIKKYEDPSYEINAEIMK